MRHLVSLLFVALTMIATACSVPLNDVLVPLEEAAAAGRIEWAGGADASCDTGLTNAGADLLARGASAEQRLPVYELDASIDPARGSVEGRLSATIPADDDTVHFRIFAGLDAFDANLVIRDVTLDANPVEFERNQSLLTIDNPSGPDRDVTVDLAFAYTVDQAAASDSIFGAITGGSLKPDQVGLLGRTDTGMQLGHWFPVWLPNGTRTDPDPAGFGDIGAFPASVICARIDAPADYSIVTGGIDAAVNDDGVVEVGAAGLRDFSVVVANDLEMLKGEVDGVEIRVWGPTGDRAALQTVLDHSLVSQRALVEAFGPYPWVELDVVSAPLGSGVGGMEWPGMVWIERSLFAGGLPGLGDANDLLGGFDLGGLLGDAGLAVDTTLEWTIAHELGHQWWHALVGNDSIQSPAVDEPLAQFAACVAMQRIHPDNWRAICEAQTLDQYAQARALGVADAAADQASDRFDSALQYGAVVYGKAPGFYFETADLIGWAELIDALAEFVDANAFTLVSTDALRGHLVEAAGAQGPAVDALWHRWFSSALGDDDIPPAELFGDFGLEDFFGDDLFNEDFGLEDFFGDDLFNEDFGLEDFFGDDSPFTFGEDGSFDFDFEFDGDDLFNGDFGLEDFFGDDSPFTFGEDGSFDFDFNEDFFSFLEDGELSDEELQQLLEDLLGG